MLRVPHLEEIENLLLLLPDLVKQQERRSIDFVANARAWLDALERMFASKGLYQAGTIASLRSGVIATEHGQIPPGLAFRGRASRSRLASAVASHAMQRAAEVASMLIEQHRPRIAEAERIAQQIVAAAVLRGLVVAPRESANSLELLRAFRRQVAVTEDLGPGLIHLEGLVGPQDALLLFGRALIDHRDTVEVRVREVTVLSSS